MLIEEILLFALTVVVITGVPQYVLFRERMVKKSLTAKLHSRKRVCKLTAVNLVLNLLATVYSFLLLNALLHRSTFSYTSTFIPLLVFFLVMLCLTFYGNGMYITSIVLEDFTLPDLRIVKSFDTQFIATHLFHGPLSHILIYSGWILIFFALSTLETYIQLPQATSYWLLLLFCGEILGVFYAFSQIYNGTVIYQFMTGTIVTSICISLLLFQHSNLSFLPITTYFLGFLIAFEISSASYLCYLFTLKMKKKKVMWDRSGGQKEIHPSEKLIDKLLEL
jgi:hypothetical protein